MKDGGDYLNCCSKTNLCNDMEGKDKETSGSDVIFRRGNLMSAIAVVVTTMAARYLAWIVNKKYSMWQVQRKTSPHGTSTSFYLLKL